MTQADRATKLSLSTIQMKCFLRFWKTCVNMPLYVDLVNWPKNRVYPGPAGSIVSYFQFPIRAEFRLVQTDRDNESHATCSGPQPATSSLKFVSTSFIKWKIIPANFARPHKWYGLNSNKLCSALSNNWLPCSSWPPVHVCSHSHLSSVERKSWSSFRDFILKILRFVRVQLPGSSW